MIIPSPDAPEDVSSGVSAPADSDPAESLSVTIVPPSPQDVARDNARGGRWAMNEYYDGCVLLGADDRPVMRNDGSRVGFFFRDVQRLADELAAGPEPATLPSGNSVDDRAAAWRAQRRALAPLDSGFNKDWDPQRPKSTLADMTKWTRLLAYHYVQTTEPEEAVRHAVADIFGKPLNGPRMRLWVPGKYNVEAVEAVADAMFNELVGSVVNESQALEFSARTKAGADTEEIENLVYRYARTNGPGSELDAADIQNDVGHEEVAQTDPSPAVTNDQPYSGVRRSSGGIPLPPDPTPRQRGGFGGPKVAQGQKVTTRSIEPKPPANQPPGIAETLKRSRLTQIWRDTLGRRFETFDLPFDGYGSSRADVDDKGREGYALGRYQMRRDSLIEAEMMTRYEEWTGKYGVYSWQDFLNNPQAQEAAMADWSDRIDHYIRAQHASRLNKHITGIAGDITVTESGLAAAIHKEGTGGVRQYFRWLEKHGWNSRDHQKELKALPPKDRDSYLAIETRLREFQNIPYKNP